MITSVIVEPPYVNESFSLFQPEDGYVVFDVLR